MKIAIGSAQETKFAAVEQAAQVHFGHGQIECTGYKVDSGVPDQPFSFDQISVGAFNRARRALKKDPNSDIAVGLEAGLERVGDRLIDFGVVQVIGKNGIKGLGITEGIALPEKVSELVEVENLELSDAVARAYGIDSIRTRDCTGIFTSGRLGVVRFYEAAVISALEDYDRQVA